MKLKLAIKIRRMFDLVETIFPDKSTEFLLEVTVQQCRDKYHICIDASDIVEAFKLTDK